jgi:hypothetical protein
MKKVALLFVLMFASGVIFAQKKGKGMTELRDSMFTVMNLSDENRQKMHDLIGESGKAKKAIKENSALGEMQKKEKQKTLNIEIADKEKTILTPEQLKTWKDFATSLRNKAKP